MAAVPSEHAACIAGAFVAAPAGGEELVLDGDIACFLARGARGGAALVLCTDIFGQCLPNVRVLALQLAEKVRARACPGDRPSAAASPQRSRPPTPADGL